MNTSVLDQTAKYTSKDEEKKLCKVKMFSLAFLLI